MVLNSIGVKALVTIGSARIYPREMLSTDGVNKACKIGFAQAIVVNGLDICTWATVWDKCLRS